MLQYLPLLFVAGCYFFPYSADIVSEKFSAFINYNRILLYSEQCLKKHTPAYTLIRIKKRWTTASTAFIKPYDSPMDMRAFHQKLSFIIDKIGCSHTNLYLPKDILRYHFKAQ